MNIQEDVVFAVKSDVSMSDVALKLAAGVCESKNVCLDKIPMSSLEPASKAPPAF